VTIRLEHSRIYAADCADCETREGMLDRIESAITLAGPLDDEQRDRLLEIAQRCPVHRTLTSEIDIRARLTDPSPPIDDGRRDGRSPSPPPGGGTRRPAGSEGA
jgi:hypothetical protein